MTDRAADPLRESSLPTGYQKSTPMLLEQGHGPSEGCRTMPLHLAVAPPPSAQSAGPRVPVILRWSQAGDETARPELDIQHAQSEAGGAPSSAAGLALPMGLAHAHIHLDKCYLLDDDRCPIGDGTFPEALEKTNAAKAQFDTVDLLVRGRKLLDQSLLNGVSAARCHVEVDTAVGHLCLDAGRTLQGEYRSRLDVRLAVFAQDPLFYPDDAVREAKMHSLLQEAARKPGVSAIGSAPYVESSQPLRAADSATTSGGKSGPGTDAHMERQRRNVDAILDMAQEAGLDVDFHTDYDLDASKPALLWYILAEFRKRGSWSVNAHGDASSPGPEKGPARLTIGHATKVSTFTPEQLDELADACRELPVAFVALPTSDLYMQGRGTAYATRSRATMPLLELAKRGVRCAVAVNNIANLFTPQGEPDPLSLLPLLVGVWQAATPEDCALLLGMVTLGAHFAVGSHVPNVDSASAGGEVRDLYSAACLLLPAVTSIQEAVLRPSHARVLVRDGRVVSERRVQETIEKGAEFRGDESSQ